MPSSKHTRYRDWCFTDYNLDTNWLKEIAVEYICWGDEICPDTGRPHLQGFLSLPNEMDRDGVIALLAPPADWLAKRKRAKQAKWKPISVRGRLGTVEQAIGYCKGGVFAGNPKKWKPLNLIFTEQGFRPPEDDPKMQGKRTDLEFAREMAKQGMTMREFTELARSGSALRVFETCRKLYEQPRLTKPFCVWLHGSTMVRKSTHAYQICASKGYYLEDRTVHRQNLGEKWWEGYDGQKAVFIDEWTEEKYSFRFMLDLCGEGPCRVEYKGGSCEMQATLIIISANKPVDEAYPEEACQVAGGIHHLVRRFEATSHQTNTFGKCVKDKRPKEYEYNGIPIEVEETDISYIPRKPKADDDVNKGSENPDTCD